LLIDTLDIFPVHHEIAELLLKLVLATTNQSINQGFEMEKKPLLLLG
jgi:hypothetical protein